MGQSNSKSRPRSRSSPEKKRQKEPLHAKFIIFGAANLTTFASRICDMAAPSASDQDENTPLLQRDEEQSGEPHSRLRDIGNWFTHHAVPFFVSLLIIAAIVILCVFFGLYRSNRPTAAGVCLTPACVHAASEILYSLSPNYQNLDPCTEFQELTCGGWAERHDLRPDQGDAFTGTIMGENSQMLLRHILEAPYPDESKHSSFSPAQLTQTLSAADQQNFEKLKAAYDACMNEEKIRKDGIGPLTEILKEIMDMFPVKNSAFGRNAASNAQNKEALADTIVYLANLGVSVFISTGAGADDKDPDTVIVQVSPPGNIGLPAKDYYSDDKVVQKYEDTLAQIINNFHPNNQSKDYARKVVNFEKQLAVASPDAEDRDDVTKYYNPMSLKDASALAPQIRLDTIINSLAPGNVKTESLIVLSPSYMSNLSSILESMPNDVLQTYMVWKVIQNYASVVEADEIKPYKRFNNELQGKDPESSVERWRTCVSHVDSAYDPNSGLGWILSRFFVEKAFSANAKDFGDQIVSDIKEMFIETLKVTKWMDNSVIDLAIEKVHKIVQKIGYPTNSPNIMDPATLLDYYRPVTISPSTFFKNALSMNKFGVAQEWSTLGKPVDRDAWLMTVPTVNAYYNPPGNEIVFPAGIMQFPVFDVNVPQYLSYGAFGSVSGHELSHAFDSTGRHYDQNGNYTDWWNDKTVSGFTARADCFVDQYHNYTVPGPDGKPLHVNGKLTLGENIADAGGVSAAFAAWKKRRDEAPNENLPGLDFFTQEQMFFVGYANWWCGKTRKETAISRIYTDPHAPKFARILGTMANSKDFQESFNCPSKEPVCELW